MLDSPKPVKKRATANKSLNHLHQHHSTGNLYDLENHHSHLSNGVGGGETKGRYKNNKNDPKSYGATVVKAFSHHRNYPISAWWRRQRKGRIMATLVFFIFLIYVTQNNHRHHHHHHHHHKYFRGIQASLQPSASHYLYNSHQYQFGGAFRPGYFYTQDAINENEQEFSFAAITDQDTKSKDTAATTTTNNNNNEAVTTKRPTTRFKATLLPGKLKRMDNSNKYVIEFQEERYVYTYHNEAGRGAEYSELQLFNDRLLTVDDRTGEVLEILNSQDGQSSTVAPRFVFTEGMGHSDKGMKWEWATVKDGELYLGSIGKELVHDDLTFKSEAGMWIAIMDETGQTRRVNWSEQYNFVRLQLFADLPGYVAHEAVNWSQQLRKWVFLPRRISQQPYSPQDDERLGSNKVLLVDEDFTTSTTVEINFQNYKDEDGGLHGFSSFAFVPNTKDRHVLATRSVEEDCYQGDDELCKFRTYFCVFDIVTGELLMDEVLYEQSPLKFEGIEFVDLFKIPPPTVE